ncbi:MAG: GNAT family N-acetyltransferase [Candidatus Brocadiaceae bacterium]
MSEAQIRKYAKRDRAAVLRITDASFGGFCVDSNIEEHFGLLAGTSWQDRKRAGIDHDLRRHPKHAFVAEIGGEIVGFVCTRLYRTTCIGHIANIAVEPAHQGMGVGRQLLQAALEHFRQCGMRYARVETMEQNYKGRKLYPSLGFEEVARQVFYLREL